MKLKSLSDVKNCSFEQRNEYTLEWQTIKYIGNILLNDNINFDKINWNND